MRKKKIELFRKELFKTIKEKIPKNENEEEDLREEVFELDKRKWRYRYQIMKESIIDFLLIMGMEILLENL